MGTQRTKNNLQGSAGERTTTEPLTCHRHRETGEYYFTCSREMTKGEMLQVFTWYLEESIANFIWGGGIKDLVRWIPL